MNSKSSATTGPVTPSWLAHEPVIIIQFFVFAVIMGMSAFGFDFNGKQIVAIALITAAILSLVTRELVVPLSTAQAWSLAQMTPDGTPTPEPVPDPVPPAPAASEALSPEPAAEMPTVTNGGLNV